MINEFCVSWHNLSFYCFPPFLCIGEVLQKIISDNATGILIVIDWPNQFWFTILQDLLLTEAFIIPPNANNLYLPNQLDLKDRFFRNVELLACLVLGRALAGKQFNLSSGVLDLFMKSLVRRYDKTVCTTFKEVV